MAALEIGDRVKITAAPNQWPGCKDFLLLDAEGTISQWFDWPDIMKEFTEYIYVMIDKAQGEGKIYEGTEMLFHEHTLTKI